MNHLSAYHISSRGLDAFTPRAYRRDFTLPAKPERAALRITASTRFRFFINGETAAHGIVRTLPAYKEYDTIDITAYLREGVNSLAAVCVYSPSCEVKGNRESLFVQLDISCSGESIRVVTDGEWLFCAADWYGMSGRLRQSSTTELQEHFDLRSCPEGWITAPLPEIPTDAKVVYSTNFWYTDAELTDQNGIIWRPVTLWGWGKCPPWNRLIERTTSMMTESPADTACVWLGSDGGEMREIGSNLAISFNESEMSGSAASERREIYDNGEHNLFVFDLDRTRPTRPGIEIIEFSGEGRIELYYDRQLEKAPSASRGFGRADEGFCDSVTPCEISADKPYLWKAVTFRGMRFVTVRICGDCRVKFRPACDTLDYPFALSRKPELDNSALSALWDSAEGSIRSSTTDYYVDTCQRENALWTLDACMTGRAAFDAFGEVKMWRASMLAVARAVDPDGVPTSLAIPGCGYFLLDQNLIWVYYLLDYYRCTGDRTLIDETLDAVLRLLEFTDGYVTEDGLLVPPSGSWHWIDWAAIDRRPYSLPINTIYIIACDAAAELCLLVGDEKNSHWLKARADALRVACERFFDSELGAFATHIEPAEPMPQYNRFSFSERDKGELYKHGIYANSLAIRANIGSEAMRRSAADYLAGKLTDMNYCNFGIGYTDLLISPLLDYGYSAQVLKFLETRFSAAIRGKYPTLGETVGSGIYNTAHGWGACVITLILRLLGK